MTNSQPDGGCNLRFSATPPITSAPSHVLAAQLFVLLVNLLASSRVGNKTRALTLLASRPSQIRAQHFDDRIRNARVLPVPVCAVR